MREIPLPRALYYTCKGGKAIKKGAIGAFFASSNHYGLMLRNKERKFRTLWWNTKQSRVGKSGIAWLAGFIRSGGL